MSTAASSPTSSPAAESVTSLLKADHERLHRLWKGVLDGVAHGDFKLIQTNAKQFLPGLRAHLEAEQQVLYTPLEQKLGTGGFGPSEDLHNEDQEMLGALHSLRRLETVTELWTATNAIEGAPVDPAAWLRSHASQVEAVIYPLIQREFNESERAEMLRKIREMGITGDQSGVASTPEPARPDKIEIQPVVGSSAAKVSSGPATK